MGDGRVIGRLLLLVGLVCASLTSPASARPWTITVGARASASPPYEGADHDVIRASPSFSIAPTRA